MTATINASTSAGVVTTADTSGILQLQTNGTAALTIDASQNVGIGTASPVGLLDVVSSGSGLIRMRSSTGGGAVGFQAQNSDTGTTATDGTFFGIDGSEQAYVYNYENAPILFGTNNTERARIDSSGNLLVGTTSAYGIGTTIIPAGLVFVSRSADVSGVFDRSGSSDGDAVHFRYNGNTVGSVSVTSTLTSYNVTSDYRLKTVIGVVTGHGERLDALEPIEYEWKSNGSRSRGFLAHKFQEVYAQSVNGTKDAVDENGNPVYQSMQASTSEVIADLVAEIQSLRQRLSAANL